MTVVDTRPTNQSLIRSAPKGSLRAIEIGGKPGIQLKILRYNVVDSYGTVWLPGCLTKSLNSRMPQLTWGHKWEDMIGRGESWQDTADGPVVDFRLDDFDDVPRARQAYSQVKSGTVDDCSVGFALGFVSRRPNSEELRLWPGSTELMEEADLDETALVLRGAVPGAKVLNFRQRGQRSRVLGLRSAQVIDAEVAARIMTELMAGIAKGEGDLLTALEQVREHAVAAPVLERPSDHAPGSSDADASTEEAADGDSVAAPETTETATTETVEEEATQPEVPEVTDPVEGDRVTEDTDLVDQITDTQDDATPEPQPDPEFDQTLADVDSLLAERETI